MPREVMIWTNPTLTIASTEAELETGGIAAQCQANSAMLTPVPATTTIPATGCAPATNSPGSTGWQLDLAWLQDWTKPADASLSQFAFANDTLPVWVKLTPNSADATAPEMVGQFFVVSGGFGGTFGDGSAGATTATWPALAKPAITAPVALAAADELEPELEPVDA